MYKKVSKQTLAKTLQEAKQMTVKETLVKALQDEGYGFFEACEIIHGALEEFKQSTDEKCKIATGKFVFTIRKVQK